MLITALLFAFQASAAQTPPLTIVVGDRRRDVPVSRHVDGGSAIRADQLSEAISGQFVADGGMLYHLQIADTRVDLQVGSAWARVAADTFPLSASVYRQSGRVYVPLSLATDLLPRVASGVLFDADRREVRRFSLTVAKRPPGAPERARESVPAPVAPTSSPVLPRERSAASRERVVIVDAGHGGVDRGMSGPIGATRKVYEKDIVLAVSRQLKASLEKRGIRVVMTRTSDTLIALGDRGRIANQAKGDLFMSIHVNAANPRWKEPGGARGYETYFLAEARTEDARRVEAMENEVIKFETTADATRDDPLGFIIRDMAQNEHLRESSRLADLVQAGLRQIHPGPSRGVKQAGFVVLVKAFMPAVLVEIGFGTNRAESNYMTDADSQRELAEALATAAEKFLAQYDRKVGGAP
jgi:N-acetylmuramoyl-L-alanine amidase